MAVTTMAAIGALLLFATFAVWRGARRAWLVVFAIAWTLWWSEALLGVWHAYTPTPPADAPTWYPEALPKVAGHVVPRDLAAGPSTTPTIVFLGDSVTAGQGVTLDQTFAAQLAARHPDTRVLVHAMPGWNFGDQIITHAIATQRAEADVVVQVFVLNDVGLPHDTPLTDFIVDRKVPRVRGIHLVDAWRRARWAMEVERQSVVAYRAAFDPMRPELLDAEARLTEAVRAQTARGGRYVVAIFPLLHRLDAYPFVDAHRTVAAMAQRAGAELLDLLPAYAGRNASTLWATRHDHHPNAEGHRIAADALSVLLGRLPDAGPAACDARTYDELGDLPERVCRGRSPDDLFALADRLVDLSAAMDPLHPLPYDAARMAAMAATLAVHRASLVGEDPDPGLQERAFALVERARIR